MNRKFVESVEKTCVQALIKRGFENPRLRTRFIRLSDTFLGWIGFNRGNHSEYLQINPFIGIHCIPVMKLKAELAQEKYKEGETATYAIHMGEVAPDVLQFIFTDDTDIESEAERLADEVVVHAIPWMEAHASFESLTPLIKDKIEMLGGFPESYASILYFSGKKSEAENFIQARSDLFDPDYKGPYSLYEKFGRPFLSMLQKENAQN